MLTRELLVSAQLNTCHFSLLGIFRDIAECPLWIYSPRVYTYLALVFYRIWIPCACPFRPLLHIQELLVILPIQAWAVPGSKRLAQRPDRLVLIDFPKARQKGLEYASERRLDRLRDADKTQVLEKVAGTGAQVLEALGLFADVLIVCLVHPLPEQRAQEVADFG